MWPSLRNPFYQDTWLRLSDICLCAQKLILQEQKVVSSQTAWATTKDGVLLLLSLGSWTSWTDGGWRQGGNPATDHRLVLLFVFVLVATYNLSACKYKILLFKCLIYFMIKSARCWQVRGIHRSQMHLRCPACLHGMVNQNKEGNKALMRDLHPGGPHY